MNHQIPIKTLPSVCPLDCPDTCSLSAKVQDGMLIDVKGSRANPYTDGVVCNKVARYYPDFVHVAQAETPKPLNFSSEGRPSHLARAPVARMTASAV